MAVPAVLNTLDNFTRADGPIGANYGLWPSDLVTLIVASNTCQTPTATGTDGSNYWNVAQFGPNSYVALKFIAWDAGAFTNYFWMGICLQDPTGTTTNDGYAVECENQAGVDNLRVYKIVNDVWTIQGSAMTLAIVPGTTHLCIVRNGNDIEVHHSADGSSWTLLGTRTDSAYATGYIGMGGARFGSPAVAVDDLRGGSIVAFDPATLKKRTDNMMQALLAA